MSDNRCGKTFYIENLGCAKNQVDAESIAGRLTAAGWRMCEQPQDAGLLLVNTCGFVEQAKQESIDTALALSAAYPDKKIVLSGCLAERYGSSLFEGMPEVAGIFGNRDLGAVEAFALDALSGQRVLRLPREYIHDSFPRRLLSGSGSAYLKIGEGCSNRCSYCAIPLIRGELRSRPRGDIVREARELLGGGVRELNLVAQDVGAYGSERGEDGLPGLLEELADLPFDFRARLLYMHPEHVPRRLFDLMRRDRRFLPYFDLPFQHASAAVLTAMGRRHTAEENLALLADLRSALPEAVVRSTFLVGFPGESDADFEDLLDFQERARLDWLGVFSFSPEEDTPAYDLHRRRPVAKKTAAARRAEIQRRQTPISEARMQALVGRRLEVLVEERVVGEDLYLGRCYAQAPEVDGVTVLSAADLSPGQLVSAVITRRNGIDLHAVPSGDGVS